MPRDRLQVLTYGEWDADTKRPSPYRPEMPDWGNPLLSSLNQTHHWCSRDCLPVLVQDPASQLGLAAT